MKNELSKNLEEWLENPFWREYYEEAPSDRCRELIALDFMYSEARCSDEESEEILREMRRTEETLELADWKHLFRYCGNNPRKKTIHDRIAELEALDRSTDSSHT